MTETTSRERVLDSAEQLFNARGYTAVSMRDIADSLALRQASLYYHVPEGKEQLYVEVVMRNLQRHAAGVGEAIRTTTKRRLQMRLAAIAGWFTNHAPLRLLRLQQSDMAALSNEHAEFLKGQVQKMLLVPIAGVFAEAQERGEIRQTDPAQLVAYFLSLLDVIDYGSQSGTADEAPDALVRDALDIFMHGLSRKQREQDR